MRKGEIDTDYLMKDSVLEDWYPKKWMESLEERYPNLKKQDFQFGVGNKYWWVRPNLYYFFFRWKYYHIRYGIWEPIKTSIEKYKVSNKIHKKMNSIASFIAATKKLGEIFLRNEILQKNFSSIMFMLDPKGYCKKNSREYEELVKMLSTRTFEGDPSFFSNKGKALASFKMMQDSKNNFIKMSKVTGKIDALMSIAKLYKKHANANARYSFVKYGKSDTPHLNISGFWSPFIESEKAIINVVTLGGVERQNMILTGPNAAGKSTHLKAITLCLLLAQTCGIAPVQQMCFAPFSKINTYLNISDTAGQESLFQAEMRRAFELIKEIVSLKRNEFSFVAMDEVFTGTNPREGTSGAYGIAKKLSSIQNSICLIATHFHKLTELFKETETFENYKVVADLCDDGRYSYPFTLSKGVSNQTIALDLLKHRGFDQEIIDTAYRVMAELS
jgi:DNA mismatch repair ATPase MutS